MGWDLGFVFESSCGRRNALAKACRDKNQQPTQARIFTFGWRFLSRREPSRMQRGLSPPALSTPQRSDLSGLPASPSGPPPRWHAHTLVSRPFLVFLGQRCSSLPGVGRRTVGAVESSEYKLVHSFCDGGNGKVVGGVVWGCRLAGGANPMWIARQPGRPPLRLERKKRYSLF